MAKKELIFIILLFVVSLTVRWYRLDQYLFFGFEQGRDASIIENIYKIGDIKLVGPKTDLSGIFHGAHYFYLMIIPSLLSNGNPLVMSFFLVALSSLTPILMYFFAKEVFGSQRWAAVTGVLTAMSYEHIIYSRWLSNVTPALPLIVVTYFLLWLYKEKKQLRFFIAACGVASIAAQFEVVLVLLFGFVFLAMVTLKVIPWPKWRGWLAGVAIAAFFFLPHVLFNFKNQNIIWNSVQTFLNTSKGEHNFAATFHDFTQSYAVVFRKTLSLPNSSWALAMFLFIATSGVMFLLSKKKKNVHLRNTVLFFVIWLSMSLPVVLFHDVAKLTQLYLGVGFAVIFLFVMILQHWWSQRLNKVVLGVVALVLAFGWYDALYKIHTHQDVFFITIQEGLNYADQRRVLQYMHDDAGGQVYRLEAFTIPYLHLEGWEYLQQYFYPNQTDRGSKLVYIAIEKQVEPFWEQKWIEDLGPSELIDEKTFGLLRVQKRILK